MEVGARKLVKFLERENQQLVIPVYQRSYSWTLKQCRELWNDIIRLASNPHEDSHFIGFIVRITNSPDSNKIKQELIIDGQQRITTVLLLIIAIISKFKSMNSARAEHFLKEFLINEYAKDTLRYKIFLVKEDRESIINLIEENTNTPITSRPIKDNYEFFLSELDKYIALEDIEKLISGIHKLMIVDIELDSTRDNPQRIFESLNSTGLALSPADLIGNFILMGLTTKEQNRIHEKYWLPMEKCFGQEDYSKFFTDFIRDYLTSKLYSIPAKRDIYEVFKKYFEDKNFVSSIDEIMQDLKDYSEYYARIALNKEEKPKLKEAFTHLKDLNITVTYPFLLLVYKDFEEKHITEEDFIKIINCIASYIFRRFVCTLPTRGLNKFFATFYKSVKHDNYVRSVEMGLALLINQLKFPTDKEFCTHLLTRNMYDIEYKKLWLERVENYGRKEGEFFRGKELTIEHIMPQTLREDWKKALGENYEDIHSRLVHTAGNLTLTNYNPEYSNRSFKEKKEITNGFNSSPLHLNKSLQSIDVWNEENIVKRTNEIAKKMCEIWKPLSIAEEEIKQAKEEAKKKGSSAYSLEEQHKHVIESGSMHEVFNELRKRILALSVDVRERILKYYIAYKYKSNFVYISPLKSKLTIIISLKFTEIEDPKGRCRDVKNIGHRGNGSVELYINSIEEIEYAMFIIEQAYRKQ